MSWWEWVFSGVGPFGIGWLDKLLRKKPTPSAAVTVQGGKIDRSIVASGRGIQQKVEFHEHHYPAPVSGAPEERPLPNLSYVGPQSKVVFISPYPREGIREPRDDGEQRESVFALLLKFTNTPIPGQRVGRAIDVIATVTFRSANRVTQRRIDYGVWLNSSCASTDLEVGDTRDLLLLIDASDQSLRTLEDKRTDINYPEESDYVRAAIVTGLLDSIEVTLTDQRSQVTYRRIFRVWMQGASFNVADVT
jgi:hypothetical protein